MLGKYSAFLVLRFPAPITGWVCYRIAFWLANHGDYYVSVCATFIQNRELLDFKVANWLKMCYWTAQLYCLEKPYVFFFST